jgi:2-keto-4-pentenoate hydratase
VLSTSPAFLRDSAARLSAANVGSSCFDLIGPGVSETKASDFSVKRSPKTLHEALVFSAELSAAQAAKGWARVGYKVGGKAPTQFFGALCSRDIVRLGAGTTSPAGAEAVIGSQGFIIRGVEIEIIAELRAPLPPRETPYSPSDAAASVGRWLPGIELCGTRLRPPPDREVPRYLRVADGASHGSLLVLDEASINVAEWESEKTPAEAVLSADGSIISRGGGGQLVGGSPSAALSWLANELNTLGLPCLRAGDLVTLGTMTGLTPVASGARVEARWGECAYLKFIMPGGL